MGRNLLMMLEQSYKILFKSNMVREKMAVSCWPEWSSLLLFSLQLYLGSKFILLTKDALRLDVWSMVWCTGLYYWYLKNGIGSMVTGILIVLINSTDHAIPPWLCMYYLLHYYCIWLCYYYETWLIVVYLLSWYSYLWYPSFWYTYKGHMSSTVIVYRLHSS